MDQPLRGMVAQSLGGPKVVIGGLITLISRTTVGAYTLGPFSVPVRVDAFLYGTGGGGSNTTISGGDKGGGGGAAAYTSFELAAGQSVSVFIGDGGLAGLDGQDSTLALPTGALVIAGGGKGSAGSRAGGVARNGLLNRSGGVGGDQSAGTGGQFGGIGGANQNGTLGAGGGGAGGFSDLGDYPIGNGNYYVGNIPYATPGGGAGSGSDPFSKGAPGQLFAIVRRV